MISKEVVKKIKNMMLQGEIAPWKAEAAALKEGIPSPENMPSGCGFRNRCREEKSCCKRIEPTLKEVEKGHFVACHLYKNC